MDNSSKNKYLPKNFWIENPIERVINEVIEPESINVKSYIPKDNLNIDIWEDDDKLNPKIRKQLLKIALEFIKFLKIKNIKIKDIILTGSLANYNWNEYSDLDLHILLDFRDISNDTELVSDFFKTKKEIWNDKIPIKLKDHDVELYVQDVNEPHASTGIYSLYKNKWINKPFKTMLGLDVSNLQAKASKIMNHIDELLTNQNDKDKLHVVEKLIDKLKKYRKCGLDKQGELSYENLVYKILRNYGYIEKLYNVKNQLLAKKLSLENYNSNDMKKYTITEDQHKYLVDKARTNSIVEALTKEITQVRNNLNEEDLITEAVSDVLKKYYKKGLLTTAVLTTLLANNVVNAQDLNRAGIKTDSIETVDQNQTFSHDQIQNELVKVLQKDSPQTLKKYQTLSDEEKHNVTTSVSKKIHSLNDIKKYSFKLLLNQPELTRKGVEQISKSEVISIETTQVSVLGDTTQFFKNNSADFLNPDELKGKLQEIFNCFDEIGGIEIYTSSNTLRNKGAFLGLTWLESSKLRADALKNLINRMQYSLGGCNEKNTVNDSIIYINYFGQNGDGTSGPESPYERSDNHVKWYQEQGIDAKFYDSKGQGDPYQNLGDYEQHNYVKIKIYGNVVKTDTNQVPNFKYLAMTLKKSGIDHKIKENDTPKKFKPKMKPAGKGEAMSCPMFDRRK